MHICINEYRLSPDQTLIKELLILLHYRLCILDQFDDATPEIDIKKQSTTFTKTIAQLNVLQSTTGHRPHLSSSPSPLTTSIKKKKHKYLKM